MRVRLEKPYVWGTVGDLLAWHGRAYAGFTQHRIEAHSPLKARVGDRLSGRDAVIVWSSVRYGRRVLWDVTALDVGGELEPYSEVLIRFAISLRKLEQGGEP